MSFTLTGFAAHLVRVRTAYESHEHHALEQAARLVESEARREIGHRQEAAGPFRGWAELADTTIYGFAGHPGKADLGHAPPDFDPLYREGNLQNSIEHQVHGNVAYVGSNSQVAVWQELGTQNIPPRSFLGGAAVRMRDEVGRLVGHDVEMVLSGRDVARNVEIP